MNKAVTELIQQRFSCRRHPEKAIETETQAQLQAFLQKLPAGPFGSSTRFELIAAKAISSSNCCCTTNKALCNSLIGLLKQCFAELKRFTRMYNFKAFHT